MNKIFLVISGLLIFAGGYLYYTFSKPLRFSPGETKKETKEVSQALAKKI